MHFATENLHKYDTDGVIWALNYERANDFLPVTPRNIIRRIGSNSFTSSMLSEAYSTLDELQKSKDDPFVIIFEPPSMDARIVNQYALFAMMSTSDATLIDWMKQHPDLYYRIQIPAEMKWEIRDRLDQANINERVLFPGMDGLSKWLKRHYSPKELPDKDQFLEE